MHISVESKELGLVATGENIIGHVSNKENVTEIKWDPLGDNISIPYEDFYEFINKKEYIYLFRKNYFLDNVAYYWKIFEKKEVK
jgi:hypothetical protein